MDMKNLSDVTVAFGILRVLHTMDIAGSAGPLGETHVAIQVSRTFVEEKHQTNGDIVLNPGRLIRSFIMASVSSTTFSVILTIL